MDEKTEAQPGVTVKVTQLQVESVWAQTPNMMLLSQWRPWETLTCPLLGPLLTMSLTGSALHLIPWCPHLQIPSLEFLPGTSDTLSRHWYYQPLIENHKPCWPGSFWWQIPFQSLLDLLLDEQLWEWKTGILSKWEWGWNHLEIGVKSLKMFAYPLGHPEIHFLEFIQGKSQRCAKINTYAEPILSGDTQCSWTCHLWPLPVLTHCAQTWTIPVYYIFWKSPLPIRMPLHP